MLCVLLGLALGLVAGSLQPVTYTAQGQLLAAGTSVNAAAVPSFAQAGQSLAQTYSRVFASDAVQQKLRAAGLDSGTESVTASPMAGTSVVLIEGKARSAATAEHLVDAGLSALQSTVADLLDNSGQLTRTRAVLKTAYAQQVKAQTALDELNRKKEPEASKAYQDAVADLGSAQATVAATKGLIASQIADSVQANGLSRLSSGAVNSSTSTQRLQFWGAIGLVAGLALWLLTAVLRSRSFRRPNPPDPAP